MTAVEFVFNAVYRDMPYPELLGILAEAKNIEKQQQGYSEEEVENILIEYVKTNPTKPYRVISWFREFKNK